MHMRRRCLSLVAAALAALIGSGQLSVAEAIRVGGTGSATEMLRHLGAQFAADSETRVEVIPSLGSGGALRAASSGILDIAVSGRELTAEESAKGLTHVFTVRSPYGFVTSRRAPAGLKSADVARLYGSEHSKWEDGTPVRIILRPRNDGDTALLGSLFPGLGAAIETARLRPDVPTAATDQDNADITERAAGSLAAASLVQISLEKRNLRFIALDGVEPTLENFENGKYPYGKTLYFVLSPTKKQSAESFISFLRSPRGLSALRESGILPSAN